MTLTDRQTQVIQLAADGLSAKEIGKALWITENTTKDHLKWVHIRLGARNRTHAVATAFRLGLIE